MRTTQRKGDIATAKAISTFTALGADVSIPLTESAPYDLVVDLFGSIKRIQVKFTSTKQVDLRNIHSNSKGYVVKKVCENTYDWLYVLNKDGVEYLVPECLHSRRSVNFYDNRYKLENVISSLETKIAS